MTGNETGKNRFENDETTGSGEHEAPEEAGGGEAPAGHAHGGTDGDRKEHPRDSARSGRKRSKKRKDTELAELLSRKNEMLQDLEDRLAESEQLIAKHEDRLLRLAAEFENYKKRTRREWELHEKQANAGLVKGLLQVLDDFNRALESPAEAGEHFRAGVRLINAALNDILAKSGLREIDALGKPFDPQVHEAVGEVATGETGPGLVAEVLQRGYLFNDQVLRPARVLVSREPEEDGGAG